MASTELFICENVTNFEIYEQKLNELNLELGTTYKLTPAVGESYDDMIDYFCNMSILEFEEYIKDCYKTELEFDSAVNNPLESIPTYNQPMRSTLTKQKCYYSGNENYLFLNAYTTTVSGTAIYTGDIKSLGYSLSVYPGYAVSSHSVSFSDDMKTASVTYTCLKYLSKYITTATTYTINITYQAGAGDIYPTV